MIFVSTSELTRWSRVMDKLLPTISALYQGTSSFYIIKTVK